MKPPSKHILPSKHFLLWFAAWLLAAAVLVGGIHPLRPGEQIGGFSALGQGVLAGRDTLTHDYPAYWWGWSQIRATGDIPLWNPSWFCGEAFAASQTFMPFYPLNWLGLLLPFPLAFNIQYPLHLVLAAAVMAWACRRRGLGWLAAGLAGLAWGFGGHLATLAGPGHIQKLQALAWLPMVTLGAWRIGRGEPRAGFLPFGLGLALQVTAGHLQIVYLTLALALLEAFAGYWGTATIAERGRPGYVPVDFRLALGFLAALFALGLSAVFWIPTAEFARLSNRQGALSWEDATRGSLPPEEAFEFALPRLSGDSMPFGRGAQLLDRLYSNFYLGRYGESSTSSPERVVSDYVGAGVLAFAFFALVARRRGRRAAWGYALLAAATLALAMGKYHPGFYKLALKVIPGLAHFRSPSTLMAALAYGLAMAAALGVQGFVDPQETDPARRGAAFRRAGAAMLALAAVALVAGLVMRLSMADLKTILQQAPKGTNLEPQLLAGLRAAAARTTLQSLALVLAPAGLWALLAGMEAQRGRRVLGIALLAAMVAAWGWDLLANVRPFWNAADAAPYTSFLTHHWATGLWSREDEPVRYLDVGNELSNRALTLSDFSKYLSIGSASGYHPVTYGRFEDLQRRLGFLNPNFLRIFGVKYIFWPEDKGRDWPEGFHEIARDPAGGKLLLYNADIRYVRPVEQLYPVPGWMTLEERLAQKGFNAYDSTTVLESQLSEENRTKKATMRKDISLQSRCFALAPGETRIKTMTRQKGMIIVAEPAAPGWRLRIDGELDPDRGHRLVTVDGFVQGIYLFGGQHDVLLFFDPVSQRLGLFITLLTLALAAFGLGQRAAAPRPHFRPFT